MLTDLRDKAPGPAAEQAQAGAAERRVGDPPKFTQGSVLRHVLNMSVTGGIGLMSIFVVDLLSLLYVSWLGADAKRAAVGFGSIVLFFAMSINIGFTIGISAIVSRALGARDRPLARRLGGSGVGIMTIAGAVVALGIMVFLDPLLSLLGARGATADYARTYLLICLPANVFMSAGIGFSGVLRACGDARRSMFVTLGGGIAVAVLDPILIFGLKLDLVGAALSIVAARLAFFAIGWHGAVGVHDLVAMPTLRGMAADARPVFSIAAPAIATNLATPVANAFFASVIAPYGDAAIGASAVIDRITPVAFGALFALSGAVGPILGQNWGAKLYQRMTRTMRDAYMIAAVYVAVMWIALVVFSGQITGLFHLSGEAADIVRLFCYISGPGWLGIGALFVANAVFNNLGFPLRATIANWGRATLGTIPAALLGAHVWGPRGALIGVLAAGALFGLGATISAFRSLRSVREQAAQAAGHGHRHG